MLRKYCFPIIISLIFGISGCDRYEDMPAEETLDSWQTFSKSNGLVSDSINCLLADSRDNIWAGTWSNGLMVYNGEQWLHFSTEDGLPSDTITALSEYYNGDIWIGTPWGISIFDGEKFTNFGLLAGVWITAIKNDFNGDIWIGTKGLGLIQFASWTDYEQYTSVLIPGRNSINCIDQKHDGTIWVGTDGGLLIIEDGTEHFFREATGLLSDTVTAILCDGFDDVWIGDYYSDCIARATDKISKISLFNGGEIVAVTKITKDHAGHIWIGTIGSGAIRYDGAAMRSFGVSDGLPSITISDIVVDNKGSIWFGSYAEGIVKYLPPLMMNQ